MILFCGIVVSFISVLIHRGGLSNLYPKFSSDGMPVVQVFEIAVLAPWAYIGFESISHSAKEFKFSRKITLPIIIFALLTAALAYIMLTVCAALAVPDGYNNWGEYISSLGTVNGIKGLPTFYAAEQAMGTTGLIVLGISAFCGIITALIANYVALGRLIHALSKDRMAPKRLGDISKRGVPSSAFICVAGISCIIPLFGRTAIGWIVDVTTVGATLVYAYTSISAFKVAKKIKNKAIKITGLAGTVFAVIIGVFYILPEFWSKSSMPTESYLILIIWSVLGMVVFRVFIQKDKQRRLGKSEIVWIILLVLIMVVSFVWIFQLTCGEAKWIAGEINSFQAQQAEKVGFAQSSDIVTSTGEYITTRIYEFTDLILRNIFIQTLIILISLAVIFSIFSVIKKREKQIEAERLLAEESNKAKTTFLSNMSHDIRTPMNAITGYTALALKEENLPDNIREYLEKIDISGTHLLSLINDILDMSRIESGKMELDPAPADLHQIMDEVYDIFAMQMKSKKINFTVDSSEINDQYIICDKNRLNRILLNLTSNACKFTPSGGDVSIVLHQTSAVQGKGFYELTVSDTGIGMSPEFAKHIFDAFERERSSTVSKIQGTGLGMSITKNFVELMGGSIVVHTQKDKGTTFIVNLSFSLTDESEVEKVTGKRDIKEGKRDFSGVKLLLTEDNPINCEIAKMVLTQEGFSVDTAENGREAVDIIISAPEDTYSVILMDIQMPVMNGYEAAMRIRAIKGAKSKIPIIALTANTFEDDRKAASEAGMNSQVSKPFQPEQLISAIEKLL